jgi:hypothetical protein
LDSIPNHLGRLSFLPPPQQHIANLIKSNEFERKHVDLLSLLIDAEDSDDPRKRALLKQKLLEESRNNQLFKKQIDSAKSLASKFKLEVLEPNFKPAPHGFRPNPEWLDPRYVKKIIPSFYPDKTDNTFKVVWARLVLYGEEKYFTEEDYIQCLSIIVQGNAFLQFLNMKKENYTLAQMVNHLTILYDNVDTLDQHKKRVDDLKEVGLRGSHKMHANKTIH